MIDKNISFIAIVSLKKTAGCCFALQNDNYNLNRFNFDSRTSSESRLSRACAHLYHGMIVIRFASNYLLKFLK